MSGRAPALLGAACAAALLLAGCTGVPTSSSPQTVEELPLGAQQPAQSITPAVGEKPRGIVDDFLQANASDPGKHTSARAFLTRAARNRWSDDTVTIIKDETVGTYNAAKHTVTVYGRMYGTLDKNGIYSPVLEGSGGGGARVSFEFGLTQVGGQYRINELRPGLLLKDTQFANAYAQHPLYFFDNDDQYLVPDPRYTDIDDRAQLSEWLLAQVAAGPRQELRNAVTSDTLPAQADPSRISVLPGAPTKVEIPGSSQLDAAGRYRLAAQLSQLLDDPLSGGAITVTDGGTAVQIPKLNATQFFPNQFSSELGVQSPAPDVYYLSGGRVYTEEGKPLPGPLGRGDYFLTAVALSPSSASGPLLAAGVEGTNPHAQLFVGNQNAGVRPVPVTGTLSRPAFAPGRHEVWIGDGSKLFRVTVDGTTGHASTVPIIGTPSGGRILAVRISPDGARIAIVLADQQGRNGQLCVGSIVRGTGQVRIDALETISPQQAVVTDVAWLNSLKLFGIGHLAGSTDSLTYDTGVDGTDWTNNPLGLSGRADSVTVTAGASAWVSVNGFVWVQSAGQWTPPTPGQTPGTDPVYLE